MNRPVPGGRSSGSSDGRRAGPGGPVRRGEKGGGPSKGPTSSRRSAPTGAVSGRAGSARTDGASPNAPRRARPAGRALPGRSADSRPDTRPITSKSVTVGLGGQQVEGRNAVRELLIAGKRRVKEVLLASDLDEADVLDDIVQLAESRRVTVRHIGRGKFESLAVTSSAQGVIARAEGLVEQDLDDLLRRRKGRAPFLVALDGVTDPQNLGAILRSAECAGVSGIILPRHRAVHVTPSVAKAAAGAIEYLPMTLVGGLPATLSRLVDLGVWVIGLDGGAPGTIYDLPLADEPIVVVLGAEGKGLSRLVRERCSALAAIPMTGQLNSLNVAGAAAVAFFDIARRRSQSAPTSAEG